MKKADVVFLFNQCVDSAVRQKGLVSGSEAVDFVNSLYSHLSVLGRRDRDALELAKALAPLFRP